MSANHSKIYAKPSPWKYQTFSTESVKFTNIPLWDQKPIDRSFKNDEAGEVDEDVNEEDGESEEEAGN